MKLNIYNKKKVVKTYEARPTDIEFGVLEDIAEKFNLDELEGVSRQDINLHILKGGLSLIGTIRDLSLFDLFFNLEVSLCERFPSLSPFDLRREKASEVFLLTRRLQKYNENKKKTHTPEGKRIIYKKAGDTWF